MNDYLKFVAICLVIATFFIIACSDDDTTSTPETGVNVTVLSDGQPVENALIFISPNSQFVIDEDDNNRKSVERFVTDAEGKASLLSDNFAEGTYSLTAFKSGYSPAGLSEVEITTGEFAELTINLEINSNVVDAQLLLYDLELNYRATEILIRSNIRFDLATAVLPDSLEKYKVIFTSYDITHYVEFQEDFVANKERLGNWVQAGGLLIMNQVNDTGWSAEFLPDGNNNIEMPPEEPENDFDTGELHDQDHPLFIGFRTAERLEEWEFTEPLQTQLKTNINFDCFDFDPDSVENPNPNWIRVVTVPAVDRNIEGTLIPANRYVAVAELKLGSGKILLNQLSLYQATYGENSVYDASNILQNLIEIIRHPSELINH